MSNKYTPGPWTIKWAKWSNDPAEPIGGFAIKAEGRNDLASLNVNFGPSHLLDEDTKRKCAEIGEPFLTPEEAIANAYLMAAAPDMYEALQPFIALAQAVLNNSEKSKHPDNTPIYSFEKASITLGNLRKLLPILEQLK